MPSIKLSEKTVDRIHFSDSQEFYYDTRLPGFGVRVGKKVKTYILRIRAGGKDETITLGRVGVVEYDEARDEAEKAIKAAAKGMALEIGKNKPEPKPEPTVICLSSVLKEYLSTRNKLKKRTREDYEKVLNRSVPGWLDLPMADITPAMVQTKHKELGEGSKAGADYAFRIIRALYNYAMEVHSEEVTRNPALRLSVVRSWYKVPRRKTCVKPTQMAEFFAVLKAHPGKMADYLEILLFTGIRSASEIGAIPTAQVDIKNKIIVLKDTKNGEDLEVPICKSAAVAFERRLKESEKVGSKFVFYALGSKTGHIGRGGKQMEDIKLWFKDTSIKSLTPHDLRRTFLTTCDELDLSQVVQKRLVGHAVSQDVTDGYKVLTIERLRKAVDRVERFILGKAKIQG
jgi:integrase